MSDVILSREDTMCRYTGHTHHNSFFKFTVPAMQAMLEASGFSRVELKSTFSLPTVRGAFQSSPHAVFHCHVDD